MTVFEKIEAQQKGKENTAPWMVGEQLKDICRMDPSCAEILEKDLDLPAFSLEAAEKKIRAWADKNKKGNCAVVPPNVAEDILRKFYGLPELPEGKAEGAPELIPFVPAKPKRVGVLDLF